MSIEADKLDLTCRKLHSARESLCVAQTHVEYAAHRAALQDALDHIDRVGVFVCPGWSKYDVPPVAYLDDDGERGVSE